MKNLLCAVLAVTLSFTALPVKAYTLSERKITYPGYNANIGSTVLPDDWTMQVTHLIIGTESITCPNAVFLTATSPDGSAKMLFLSERQFVETYTSMMGFDAHSSDDVFDYSSMMHTVDYRDAAGCCDLTASTLFDGSPTFLKDLSLSVEDQAILADAKGRYDAAVQEEMVGVLENVIGYVEHRSPATVKFVRDFPNPPVNAKVNASLFGWVIENICKNAVDAMSGKGRLTIKLAEEKNFVSIDVTDTGKGIPKSSWKSVFDPGYTTKERGWGLGLSLAKRIVTEYHKGKIYVSHSELNKGTTFHIEIPK